jgi:hypothetical protein
MRCQLKQNRAKASSIPRDHSQANSHSSFGGGANLAETGKRAVRTRRVRSGRRESAGRESGHRKLDLRFSAVELDLKRQALRLRDRALLDIPRDGLHVVVPARRRAPHHMRTRHGICAREEGALGSARAQMLTCRRGGASRGRRSSCRAGRGTPCWPQPST